MQVYYGDERMYRVQRLLPGQQYRFWLLVSGWLWCCYNGLLLLSLLLLRFDMVASSL